MTYVVDPPVEAALAAESLVLDPSEIAADRTELNLNLSPIVVKAEGVDWGDAQFEPYMAQLVRGEVPVDGRLPNRQITIPLLLGVNDPSLAQAKADLQAKVALFQRSGGWLRRGDGLYAEIVNATLSLPDTKYGLVLGYETDTVLTLAALPDFFGDEAVGALHTASTPEVTFTEPTVSGDYPGRVRVQVSDTSGQTQRGLLWGFRCDHYDPAAPLAYQAGDLTPLDAATVEARAGAVGSVVQHANLSSSWTPVLSTGFLSHTGTYRLWARVYAEDTVKLRAVYDVGDMTLPEENVEWTVPGTNNFYLADLGVIRLDHIPVGDHRWQCQIQAKGTTGGELVEIDRLYLQPLDEGAGKLTASPNADIGISSYQARDEFNQTPAALTGTTAPVGGAWTGAGDSTDFQIASEDPVGGGVARRTAVSDADLDTGRYAILGSSTASTVAQVDLTSDVLTGPGYMGVLARYADASNWLSAVLLTRAPGDPVPELLRVRKRVAGTVTELAEVSFNAFAGTEYTIRLQVDESGAFAVWLFPKGGLAGAPKLVGQHADLASGGSLATGKAGVYNAHTAADANDRDYNNFAAWSPAGDAVLFPNRTLELRTDGMVRQDSTGAAYGPVSKVLGDLPRLPPSGLEGRSVEVFLLSSRGDFGSLPDAGVDDKSARVISRPSFLFPPVA